MSLVTCSESSTLSYHCVLCILCTGYIIELVVRNDGVQEIEDLVRRRLPGD